MKNNLILFATAYPYTMSIIAIIWIGTAFLFLVDKNLPVLTMVIINSIATVFIASIGFKK